MFGKKKSKDAGPLLDSAESKQNETSLKQLEIEIRDCQAAIEDFFRPLKDLRAKMVGYRNAIDFEQRNFGSDDTKSKASLLELQGQEKAIEEDCKTAVKKSGLLDKFTELNELKSKMLEKDSSQSRYVPPSAGQSRK